MASSPVEKDVEENVHIVSCREAHSSFVSHASIHPLNHQSEGSKLSHGSGPSTDVVHKASSVLDSHRARVNYAGTFLLHCQMRFITTRKYYTVYDILSFIYL